MPRYIFQQSMIWEGTGKVDPHGEIKNIKAKDEQRARRRLPSAGLGRDWILVDMRGEGASRYMRLRLRLALPDHPCNSPGCQNMATWWGANIPDGRLEMCDEHKTNYANILLKEGES